MGFATIIAVIAFFVAMIALWLASDVVKKVENQNEKFVRAHIHTLREEISEVDKQLLKVAKAVKAGAETQSGLDSRLNDHTKILEGLTSRTTDVVRALESLDNSIPQRYRARVAAKGEKAKAKPSIQ